MAFADDNQVMVSNENLVRLIQDMEMKLEVMMKWLKDSGLTVNDTKTEVCLFNRGDHAPIALTVNNIQIRSKTTMNVLGVEFDSKLQWSNHIAKAIGKSRRALHAIRLIRNYFTQTELKNLITSNFYSILY